MAVKQPDGKVYLQEVYLGQDKQGDGWGPLKGHTDVELVEITRANRDSMAKLVIARLRL